MANSSPVRDNLPAHLSSFVGRRKEIEQIRRKLEETRLLTLTGPGGSGKTRLALEAARLSRENFPDGLYLVKLADLAEPHLLTRQVALVFGLREEAAKPLLDSLTEHLQGRHLLLVLDNCEHLLEACAGLCESLLEASPGLQIMATSRESLRIEGETVLPVPPLEFPPLEQAAALSLAEIAATGAVQLFLQRGRAVEPNFSLTEQNRASVVQLCQSLDGLPLSLELAAARLRGLSVTQLSSRIQNTLGARFRLLNAGSRTASPRHQTLQALLDWSYDRLTEREQVLLRRLSVFAGDFDLEAAEAVCPGPYEAADGQGRLEPGEMLELLSQLVNKSLLQPAESPDEPRYRLLETVREYSLEKAARSGEIEAIRQRHVDWCIALAGKALPHLQGPEQSAWLDRLEQANPNFRAALGWASLNNELEKALRLAGALWRFWQARSYFIEGRRWLEELLAAAKGYPVNPAIRARALQGAGVLSSFSDYPASLVFHQENLSLRREMGDKTGLITALKDLGWVALHHNDYAQARSFADESLELARELDDKAAGAASMFILAVAAFHQDDISQAGRLCQECLALWREMGDTGSVASALHQLGMVALKQAAYRQAGRYLHESLDLNRQLGNRLGVANNMLVIIELGAAQPDQPRGLHFAVRLLGWITAFTAVLGGKMPPLARQHYEAGLAACRARLDEPAFEKLWAEGSLLNLEQAVQLALDATSEPSPLAPAPEMAAPAEISASKPLPPLPEPLTGREIEVLRLVVEGLTNSQAAEKLSVTSRTINAHLTSIYAKLGVTSRAGAIRCALENHLV